MLATTQLFDSKDKLSLQSDCGSISCCIAKPDKIAIQNILYSIDWKTGDLIPLKQSQKYVQNIGFYCIDPTFPDDLCANLRCKDPSSIRINNFRYKTIALENAINDVIAGTQVLTVI